MTVEGASGPAYPRRDPQRRHPPNAELRIPLHSNARRLFSGGTIARLHLRRSAGAVVEWVDLQGKGDGS